MTVCPRLSFRVSSCERPTTSWLGLCQASSILWPDDAWILWYLVRTTRAVTKMAVWDSHNKGNHTPNYHSGRYLGICVRLGWDRSTCSSENSEMTLKTQTFFSSWDLLFFFMNRAELCCVQKQKRSSFKWEVRPNCPLLEIGSLGTNLSIPIGLRKILQQRVVENGIQKKSTPTYRYFGRNCSWHSVSSLFLRNLVYAIWVRQFCVWLCLCGSLVVERSVVRSWLFLSNYFTHVTLTLAALRITRSPSERIFRSTLSTRPRIDPPVDGNRDGKPV